MKALDEANVVKALQYATLIKLEIYYVVRKVCKFMSSPTKAHWVAIKKILKYLKRTISHGLLFHHTFVTTFIILNVFCVADRASTLETAFNFGPKLV